MKKFFLFFVFQMLAFALHAQTFTFNMYDANDQSKKITVTVNTSSQNVTATSGGSTLFSFSYYGHYIYKEKNRIGLSPVQGGTVDVNASTSNYFIVIRDNGNILVCLNGKEYPMRSVNNSATQSTYDQLARTLNNPSTTSNRTFTVNGVSFTMVYVQGGTFTMGATSEQGSDAFDDEKPAHSVTLSSYMIGQTEVTQALWQAVMGNNPSYHTGDSRRPVEQVSWDDCQTFLRKLNSLTGQRFRLPTEAEWEFAARGGVNSRGYKYSGSNTLGNVAWYDDNSGDTTHPVGTKQPNELDIYDMTGNVWEWCNDKWDSDYYSSSPSSNPQGPSSGSTRVLRGGSWCYDARSCRVSYRYGDYPGSRYADSGLRLAL